MEQLVDEEPSKGVTMNGFAKEKKCVEQTRKGIEKKSAELKRKREAWPGAEME